MGPPVSEDKLRLETHILKYSLCAFEVLKIVTRKFRGEGKTIEADATARIDGMLTRRANGCFYEDG